MAVFAVYCLFPYTAVYVASALTETLTLFVLSLAIYFFMRGLGEARARRWFECGAVCAAAVILRPDGGLVLIAFGVYLLWRWLRRKRSSAAEFWSGLVRPGVIIGAVALLPLVPWTARNWNTFKVIQPLAPVNATDPGERSDPGFVQLDAYVDAGLRVRVRDRMGGAGRDLRSRHCCPRAPSIRRNSGGERCN